MLIFIFSLLFQFFFLVWECGWIVKGEWWTNLEINTMKPLFCILIHSIHSSVQWDYTVGFLLQWLRTEPLRLPCKYTVKAPMESTAWIKQEIQGFLPKEFIIALSKIMRFHKQLASVWSRSPLCWVPIVSWFCCSPVSVDEIDSRGWWCKSYALRSKQIPWDTQELWLFPTGVQLVVLMEKFPRRRQRFERRGHCSFTSTHSALGQSALDEVRQHEMNESV